MKWSNPEVECAIDKTSKNIFFIRFCFCYISRACVYALFASATFTFIYYVKVVIIFFIFQRKHAQTKKFLKELDPVPLDLQLKVNMHVVEILYVVKPRVYKGK